jgi:hypothetical protein
MDAAPTPWNDIRFKEMNGQSVRRESKMHFFERRWKN